MGLFSKSELLGLDIGSNSIKAVELDWRKKSPRLKVFGMIHLPPEAIVDGAFMDSASIVDSIRSLVEGLKVKTKKRGRVDLRPFGVHQDHQCSQHVQGTTRGKHQVGAEQQIPFDIEDVNIDFQILETQTAPDQMPVLLVAAKKDMINDYTAVIEEAGLTPTIVDVDSFAIENAFNLTNESPPDEVAALVNIGASVMNINILQGGLRPSPGTFPSEGGRSRKRSRNV